MNKIITIFSIFISISVSAQNLSHNLEKYWYYRDKLRQKLIYVSPNDEPGSNTPVEIYYKNDSKPYFFGDGNGNQPYYLGMLATEYKLLKDYGQDYTQTLNELIYALKAFERLDAKGESYYRQGTSYPDDLNGFYIRNDIDSAFTSEPGNYLPNDPSQTGILEMSQDTWLNYMLNLALVKKLVDDGTTFTDADGSPVTVSGCVDKIVDRVMAQIKSGCLHWTVKVPVHFNHWSIHINFTVTLFDACVIKGWFLQNPVTGATIKQNLGGWAWELSTGHADAAESITGKDYQDAFTIFWRPIFEQIVLAIAGIQPAGQVADMLLGVTFPYECDVPVPIPGLGTKVIHCHVDIPLTPITHWLAESILNGISKHINKIEILMTLAGNKYVLQKDVLTTLISMGEAMTNYNGVISNEHFPLIYLILYGTGDEPKYNVMKQPVEQLLNEAPNCGPYKIGVGQNAWDFSPEWGSDNRLVWPENCGNNNKWTGDYSGIDYMLLHNLYWLVYVDQDPKNVFVHQTYPKFGLFTGWTGSVWSPLTIDAENNITADNKLTPIADVTYNAGNEVVLNPGFETSYGAEFEAVGNGIGAGSIDYKYIAYHPDCSFRDNYKAYIDTLHRQVQKPDTTSYDNEITSFTADTVYITLSEEDIKNMKNNNSENIYVSANQSDSGASKIYVMPNPNNGKFSIMVPQNKTTAVMSISDMLGTVILSKQFTGQFAEADISAFPGGVYLLKINAEGRVYTQKIVFRKE